MAFIVNCILDHVKNDLFCIEAMDYTHRLTLIEGFQDGRSTNMEYLFDWVNNDKRSVYLRFPTNVLREMIPILNEWEEFINIRNTVNSRSSELYRQFVGRNNDYSIYPF